MQADEVIDRITFFWWGGREKVVLVSTCDALPE
jgi:hypothetical protein